MITGISEMIRDLRSKVMSGYTDYDMYRYLKSEYLKCCDKHPDFCGFVELFYEYAFEDIWDARLRELMFLGVL